MATNRDRNESRLERVPIIAKNSWLEKRNAPPNLRPQPLLADHMSLRPSAPTIFPRPFLGPALAEIARSNSFSGPRNSYSRDHPGSPCFERFTDGMRFALSQNRRSGAQRGASENNFGQRFSVSTPCSFCSAHQPSPA